MVGTASPESVRLHIVTGKGGTGKTTVAASLALALASGGRKVLLAEVEGRQGISQTFEVPPLATEEVKIAGAPGGGEVFGLSVDAKAAFVEYLQLFYKLGRAGGLLERFGATDFATTIAPGVRDVLLIGRIYEANRRRASGGHGRHDGSPAYDAIVLDAPPTGRVVRFLSVNHEVAGLAKVGPIRSQADSITEMLTSPGSVVHVVTLLEEMPVQESVDAITDLRAAGLNIGSIVVNQVREPELPPRQLAAASRSRIDHEAVRVGLAAAGLKASDAVVEGLVAQARDHALRVAQETEQRSVLDALDLPIRTLPATSDGVEVGTIRWFADLLTDEGMVP